MLIMILAGPEHSLLKVSSLTQRLKYLSTWVLKKENLSFFVLPLCGCCCLTLVTFYIYYIHPFVYVFTCKRVYLFILEKYCLPFLQSEAFVLTCYFGAYAVGCWWCDDGNDEDDHRSNFFQLFLTLLLLICFLFFYIMPQQKCSTHNYSVN